MSCDMRMTMVGIIPAITPFIEAARKLGCVTGTGTEMYDALQHLMVDFLLTPMEQR